MVSKCRGCNREFYLGPIIFKAHICKICGEPYCFKYMHGYVCIDCMQKVPNPKVRQFYDFFVYGSYIVLILSFGFLIFAFDRFLPLIPTESAISFVVGLMVTWVLVFGVGGEIFRRLIVKMIEIDMNKPEIKPKRV